MKSCEIFSQAIKYFQDKWAKYFRIVEDEQQFAEVGYGNLNWDKIIEACRKTGIEIAAVEQDGFTDNPIESLCMSFDYLNKHYTW